MYDNPDGAMSILIERERQISKEGWTLEHDDEHTDYSLLKAAECYLTGCVDEFPWNKEWFKPSPNNRIRDLEKAGALIAAEIDRLKIKS